MRHIYRHLFSFYL